MIYIMCLDVCWALSVPAIDWQKGIRLVALRQAKRRRQGSRIAVADFKYRDYNNITGVINPCRHCQSSMSEKSFIIVFGVD